MTANDFPAGASGPIDEANGVIFRPSGSWSASVHELLRHLESVGFAAAPRFLGTDHDGREMLTFIEGQIGHYPLPSAYWSDDALRGAGRLLRRFHDATVSLVSSPDARWQLAPPDDLPIEVICHNDFAPYNCVFRGSVPVAMIDFEMAAPGSRGWDLAYTAYRFVPLTSPDHWPQFGFPTGRSDEQRLVALLDAYGLERCGGFIELVVRRVAAVRDLTAAMAAEPSPSGERVRREQHVESYDRDLAWLSSNARRLRGAIGVGAL